MSLGAPLSPTGRWTICERLVAEVGGYLRNVVRAPMVTCAVCAAPVNPTFDLCRRCARDRREFGDALADLVVPVCYGIRGTQSGHLMYSYKDITAPARHNQTLLSVLLLAALDLHAGCIEHHLGHMLDAWSIVPSVRSDRSGEHPLHVVAKRAGVTLPEVGLVAREQTGPTERATTWDRFSATTARTPADRHILLIEDTWTSGGNAQSAALTLRRAGAASVTILALARWLNPGDPLVDDFIATRLIEDYCPLPCPVGNPDCAYEQIGW